MARPVERRDEVSPELALVDPELRLRLGRELAAEEARLASPPPRRVGAASWLVQAVALFVVMYGLAFAFARMPSAAGAPLPEPREPIDVWATPPPMVMPAPTPSQSPRPKVAEARRPPDAARVVPRKPAAVHRRPPWRETEPATDLLGPLPSPTPPALRLYPTAARALLEVAQRRQVDWASLLAGTHPWRKVTTTQLEAAARHLKRSPGAVAAAAYARAVGLDALVSGLSSARSLLAARVLR